MVTNTVQKKTMATTLTALGLAGVVSACQSGGSGSSASRAEIYDSFEQLADDSYAAVVVEVASQREIQEGGFTDTVSTGRVRNSFGSQKSDDELAPRSNIDIRQLGSLKDSEVPAPLLEVGRTYLLLLSGSPEQAQETQGYYITGMWAGMYELPPGRGYSGDAASFNRTRSEGDTLPQTVSFKDVSAYLGEKNSGSDLP